MRHRICAVYKNIHSFIHYGKWEDRELNDKKKDKEKPDGTTSVFFEFWKTVKSSAPHQKCCYVEELFNKK